MQYRTSDTCAGSSQQDFLKLYKRLSDLISFTFSAQISGTKKLIHAHARTHALTHTHTEYLSGLKNIALITCLKINSSLDIQVSKIMWHLRVLLSVSAATNCRYFFIKVVWSTTVGLGAGTKAMVAAGRDSVAISVRQTSVCFQS